MCSSLHCLFYLFLMLQLAAYNTNTLDCVHNDTHKYLYCLLLYEFLYSSYSDNGAWTRKELDGGSNGLLRGQKGETYEGGIR